MRDLLTAIGCTEIVAASTVDYSSTIHGFLVRHLGEERATFGLAFDLPLLVARLTVHGLFTALAGIPERHDDLLPVARRLFRRPLGGARLADVERGVLVIERVADLPGSEVPGRWWRCWWSWEMWPLSSRSRLGWCTRDHPRF